MNTFRIFSLWFAISILLFAAGFHLTGLPMMSEATQTINNPFLENALEPLWILPAIHWLTFAVLLVWVSVKPTRQSSIIMTLIAASLFTDAILLYVNLGPFIGAIMLTAVSVAILITAALLKVLPPIAD